MKKNNAKHKKTALICSLIKQLVKDIT